MKRILFIIILAWVSLTFGQNKKILIEEGSGTFTIKGGKGNENKTVTVYYYKPKTFNTSSKVLLVIPGSGRNGDSYRDSWIEESEKHNVLILSPSYPEIEYPYEDYHLGGIVKDVNTRESISFIKNTNQVFLDEDKALVVIH